MLAKQNHLLIHTISKQSGMVKSPRIAQEIIIYIMTTTNKEILKRKIALNKARSFLSFIKGVCDLELVECVGGDIDEYHKKIKGIYSYQREFTPKREVSLDEINHEVTKWQCECIDFIIGKEVFIEVNDFYFATFKILDGLAFLESVSLVKENNDLALFVRSPKGVLAFSDDEYTISFYEELI